MQIKSKKPTRRIYPRVAMEVMVPAQSDTPLRALRALLNRRVLARRGGDYSEVSHGNSGDLEEELPIPERLYDPICV